MLYFRATITSKNDLYAVACEKIGYSSEKNRRSLGFEVNKNISAGSKSDNYHIFITNVTENQVEIYSLARYEYIESHNLRENVQEACKIIWSLEEVCEFEEIGVKEFSEKVETACQDGYFVGSYRSFSCKYNWDYFSNCQFELKEEICVENTQTEVEIVKEAKEMLSDKSLLEEITRIYDKDNPDHFVGHPVHYRINSGTIASVEICKLLMKALFSQHRIYSKRINKITNIASGCYDEQDLDSAVRNAIGGTVIIEMQGKNEEDGRTASTYHRVIEFLGKIIQKYNDKVLFVLIDNKEEPGFSKQLVAQVTEYIDLIDIYDGNGSKNEAQKYFEKIRKQSNFVDYETPDLDEIFKENRNYELSEIHALFDKWSTGYLRRCVYKAYAQCKVVEVEQKECGKAYSELQKLIGLENVKSMVDQIIASSVVDKNRASYGNHEQVLTKHMIFTGNPGSCKTTVARLLASTLKEEGVLETGDFVECGRADLTGKYVGWTDKKVRAKFREAKGGILFIDEAYALVEEGGYYGDEAINTIVQEMENHRDDVIVIFAGYPDKMKQFLDKNEGLRSRIAFYVDFPDYCAAELEKIFQKMLQEKSYRVTEGALKKARRLFLEAVKMPEFGNGRFARNIVEQAMMKQSLRLYKTYKGKEISKKELFTLTSDDFELENIQRIEKKPAQFGFKVCEKIS